MRSAVRQAAAVGRDLDRQRVLAGGADLGPARPAGLEQQAAGVGRGRLVDLQLVPRPVMAQQHRRRRDGQPVGIVGAGVQPQPGGRQPVVPGGAVPAHRLRLGLDPGLPARLRREKGPGAVLEGGDTVLLPDPGAAGRGGDDVPLARRRIGRRRGQVAARHRRLHQHVEPAERLVMGDMLLRLGRLQVGQGKKFRDLGHEAILWNGRRAGLGGQGKQRPSAASVACPVLQRPGTPGGAPKRSDGAGAPGGCAPSGGTAYLCGAPPPGAVRGFTGDPMPPKFGTSGLRGLVTELTPELVAGHVRAFVDACPDRRRGACRRDLRPSSPGIAAMVIATVRRGRADRGDRLRRGADAGAGAGGDGGGARRDHGHRQPYPGRPQRAEVLHPPPARSAKADEAAHPRPRWTARAAMPPRRRCTGADRGLHAPRYVARYVGAFGPEALAGLRIGRLQHTSVARDALVEVLARARGRGGGAGRGRTVSCPSIPRRSIPRSAHAACRAGRREHGLDAIVSTDGDADRPLVADAAGRIVPGDVLGPLTARFLGAGVVVTPVSSNTPGGRRWASTGPRTRIGSPFVIAAMEAGAGRRSGARGGGLRGQRRLPAGLRRPRGPAGPLPPLMTRDAVLPILAPLAAAAGGGAGAGRPGRGAAAALHRRRPASQGIAPRPRAASWPGSTGRSRAPGAFFAGCDGALGAETGLDRTDGLRLRLCRAARSCTCAPRATRPSSAAMPRPPARSGPRRWSGRPWHGSAGSWDRQNRVWEGATDPVSDPPQHRRRP